MSHNHGHSSNGHPKPMTPEQRAHTVSQLRDDAKTLSLQGDKAGSQRLLFKASEIELKVGEGPYKNRPSRSTSV